MSAAKVVVQGPHEGCIVLNKTGAAVTASFRVVLLLHTAEDAAGGKAQNASSPVNEEVVYVLYRLRVKESSIRISRIYGLLYADAAEAVPHLADTLSLIAEAKLCSEGKLSVVRVEYVALSAPAGRALRRHGEVEKAQCATYFHSSEAARAAAVEHGPVQLYHAHCVLAEGQAQGAVSAAATHSNHNASPVTSSSSSTTATPPATHAGTRTTTAPTTSTSLPGARRLDEQAKDGAAPRGKASAVPSVGDVPGHAVAWHRLWRRCRSRLLLAGLASGATLLLLLLRQRSVTSSTSNGNSHHHLLPHVTLTSAKSKT